MISKFFNWGAVSRPAATTTNPFDAPVGSGGPSSHVLRQDRCLAPCLLNRSDQAEAVRTRLRKLKARKEVDPLLVVLPATMDDLHNHFVNRIGLIELVELLGGAPVRHQLNVPWPKEANVDDLLSNLADRFWPGVGQPSYQLSCSICFQLTLYSGKWSEHMETLSRRWVDYISEQWPSDPNGNVVVAFLCAIYENDPNVPGTLTPASKKLERFVQTLAGESSDSDRVVVLDPLPVVEFADFDQWIAEIQNQLGDFEIMDKLSAITGQLFKQGGLRFNDVHREVHVYFRNTDKRVHESG